MSTKEGNDLPNYRSHSGSARSNQTNRVSAGPAGLHVRPDSPEGLTPIPHSVEAEEAVLGALLIDREVISTVAPVLKPFHFFSEVRQGIYQALLNLYADHTPADLITVKNELGALGILGEGENQVRVSYLLKLLKVTPSPVHAAYYTEIVFKTWLARQLMQECARTFGSAQSGPGKFEPARLLTDHVRRVQALGASLANLNPSYFLAHEKTVDYPFTYLDTSSETSDSVAVEGLADQNQYSNLSPSKSPRPQLKFGWETFDGGDWTEDPPLALLPSTLTTILARSGGGETSATMQMQIADYNAKAGLKVLYFHVELNHEQMMARRYCRLSGVSTLRQLLGRIGDAERHLLVQASAEVAGWPGRVDFVHCPHWSIGQLVNEIKARHFALIAPGTQGYGLVVLDYLQGLGRANAEETGRWGGGGSAGDGGWSSHQDERESLVYNLRAFLDCASELNLAALMTSQVGRNDLKKYEPPEVDEGLGTGDIERCSNQLLALAVNETKTAVKWAIRKNTFGQEGGSGELIYDARRLQFL